MGDDPMAKRSKPAPQADPTPSEALRAEIARRGLTAYAVGKLAGVDVSILQRFLTGERLLSLKTFDKVCVALGMALRKVGED
jgi:transcriptional regulator with XRE-family HTH domain